MFSLREPTTAEIEKFLADQRQRPFSYPHVGATWGRLPRGYFVDHSRVLLGRGSETFERACEAIRQWAMYPRDVVELHPATPPLEVGQIAAPLARLLGVWALAACRVVYVVDERDGQHASPRRADGVSPLVLPEERTDVHRFGFAYGTVAGHPETGEERFLVEHRLADDTVWYDLLAFSRPNHFLSLLALPRVRTMQKRFGRRSLEQMQRAIGAPAPSFTTQPGRDTRRKPCPDSPREDPPQELGQ